MTLVPEHLRITKITTTIVMNEEPDRRYRIVVSLHRSDRPKYWIFSCPHCKEDLDEMVNVDIASMSDLLNFDDVSFVGVGRRCPGKHCRYWYYFNLSS